MRHFTLFTVIFLALAEPLVAQTDQEEVLHTIAVMFEGLKNRDTALMATVLDDEARLVQTLTQDGQPTMRSVPIPSFLGAIGQDGPDIEERYWDPEVRVHDNLATVWISYSFFVAGELSHCGEDTFQLARTTGGWQIVAIADTQRREGCSGGD